MSGRGKAGVQSLKECKTMSFSTVEQAGGTYASELCSMML